MSVDAISALERGTRRAPRRDTVALLLEALAPSDPERTAFETAAANARPSSPVDSTRAPAHNLPLPLTSFYGRQRELETLMHEVVEHRLTTIVGFGGVGKTRLAIETGWKLLGAFPDGVYLVELAPVSDPESVASRIATTLGLPGQAGQLAGDLWVSALRDRRVLLILDNCEHVIDAVSRTTQRLLQSCREFRVLATSREALRVPGERVRRLEPLELPAAGDDGAGENVRAAAAVMLFVDRVCDMVPDFALPDDDIAGWRSVRNVCAKLDGIPLALELAAARVGTLGLTTLERGLDDRFRMLRGGARTALPRQQTLQATLDWSYAALDEQEQRVFDRLGVFAGSFSSSAAAAVCNDAGAEPDDILGVLSSLVEKSLVATIDAPPSTRYRLLETTRAYALQRLRNDGGTSAARRRHADHYYALSIALRTMFGSAAFAEWAETYAEELDNFRAALSWTIDERGDVILGAAILWNLKRLFEWRNLDAEGLGWCHRTLAALGNEAPAAVEAGIQMIATRLRMALGGFHAAIPTSQRAADLYRSLGAELQLAFALSFSARALASHAESRAKADELLDEALSIYAQAEHRPLADIDGEGDMQRRLMYALAASWKALTMDPEQVDRRRACLIETVERFNALSPGHFIVGVTLANLSELELDIGAYDIAMQRAIESLEVYRGPGSPFGYIYALNAAGAAALALGDVDAARDHARTLLSVARRLGSAPGLGMVLLLLAAIDAPQDLARAAGLLGAWEACDGRIDAPEVTTHFLCARVNETFDLVRDRQAMDAGSRWSLDEVIEIARRAAEPQPARTIAAPA
jgi:predicted ATPase